VKVSAKAEYAVLAALEPAAAPGGPVKRDAISESQEIPVSFLENILSDLRNAGLVNSQRGADGGHWLARPPQEIALADVIRAVDGAPGGDPRRHRVSCRALTRPLPAVARAGSSPRGRVLHQVATGWAS
jgi:Rrf2 family protein